MTRFTLVLAMSLSVMAINAEPLKSILPGVVSSEFDRLSAGMVITASPKAADGLVLAPTGSEGDKIRSEVVTDPGKVVIEMGCLIRRVQLTRDNELKVFADLSRISTLSGVTYRSYSRNEAEVVLFSDVFRVSEAGSKKAIAEIAPTAVPVFEEFEVHVKDANFGSSWYSVEIDSGGRGFMVSLTNSKPLSAMLVRAFAAGDLRLRVAVVPADEGIYVYSVCAADPAALIQKVVDMYSAIEKRLNAVRGWAVDRIEGSAL